MEGKCIGYLLLYNNITTNVAAWHSLAGSSAKLQSGYWPRQGSHGRLICESASKLKQFLAEFNFLQALGWRASTSCWLLAGSCPQFLAVGAFPSWLLASSTPMRESFPAREVIVLCKVITEVMAHHPGCILLVKNMSRSCPLKGKELSWDEYLEVGIMGTTLRAVSHSKETEVEVGGGFIS